MSKVIAHISDLHIRNYQKHDELRAVSDNFFSKMDIVKPDRIAILGDLVHSRNQVTPELFDELSNFLYQCSLRTDKVIIIPGNHDIVEQNKERMDALTPVINALKNDKIVYYKNGGLYPDGDIVWVVYSIYDNNMSPDNLPMKPYPGTYIGLYHGVLNGSVNERGYMFNYGAECSKFNDCDIVLCGDLHLRSTYFTPKKAPIIFAGSFYQNDFGENVSNHGYNIVTLDEGKITYEFFDIENPVKYLNFKISDFEDINENKEILTNI